MGDIADMYDMCLDEGYSFDHYEEFEVKCKYCEATGLQWTQIDGRWVLFNPDGEIHNCRKNLTADELAKLWP